MNRLIFAELFKLRKRAMTWILLYILIGIIVLLYLLLYTVSNITLPSPGGGGGLRSLAIATLLSLPMAIPFGLSILTSFGTVLAVILMASSTGNEYNWRTIRVALTASESRAKFLAAKLISVLFLVLLGMIIGVATAFVMSMIVSSLLGKALDFSFATGSYGWDQLLQFWRTFYVMLVYMMLGFLFAVLGRSAMPGIAVGVGILFLEPIITTIMRLAGGWVANVPDYLIAANVEALNALNQLPSGFGAGAGAGGQAPSVTQAYEILAGYILVSVIISLVLFRKRDVTG